MVIFVRFRFRLRPYTIHTVVNYLAGAAISCEFLNISYCLKCVVMLTFSSRILLKGSIENTKYFCIYLYFGRGLLQRCSNASFRCRWCPLLFATAAAGIKDRHIGMPPRMHWTTSKLWWNRSESLAFRIIIIIIIIIIYHCLLWK